MMNALFEELDEGGFTYDISHNAEGRISRLFIAHPLSIKLAKAFSNIFLMDCIYKTNKYNMPLLDIIGVSLFSWKEKMQKTILGHYVHLEEIIGQEPCVIMSDRELALMNGIIFFPTTSNLLCVWDIEKNVLANYKKYFGRAKEFDIFTSDWNNVVYTTTEALFEENWFEFMSIHKEKKDAIEYIKNVWLPGKQKFVSA
uniref:Protein FAR1-RELATED SEQUENCE n=1 Tax=Lactuca sativa TaxID=4236 RepID=A0A9R1X658_LACSA|nr:hypothetical protein LSAT_V11C600301060 [Lactuca sativa]